MSNEDQTQVQAQEQYLTTAKLKDVCLRGIKKLVTEVSSIKTMVMAVLVILVWYQKMDAGYGLIGLLALVGAKEVDFGQLVEILKSRLMK